MKKQIRHSISIPIEDVKRLAKYKIHPNQPYWEVIKNLINEKEGKEK